MVSLLSRDDLTGVLTRNAGENALRQAMRHGAPVTVLFVDVDHFKSINDAFGHEVGDKALHFVAQRLCTVVGDAGEVARYGGDEFFLVLPGMDEAAAREIAQRLLDDFSEHVVSSAYPLHLRLSIGLAVGPQDGETAKELLQVADRRHYFAKHAGGHCVVATDRPTTHELVAVPRRPIGQRKELAALYEHLKALLDHPSGVIRVQSPPFGGAANFLHIAQGISRLEGYQVVPVEATPARHLRYLGAMGDAVASLLQQEGLEIPPLETEDDILQALQRLMEHNRPARGLMLTVSDASWLDKGSMQLLQSLLRLPEGFEHVGLVYATVGHAQARFRAPMYANLSLSPLTVHEVKAWIRHAIRWEPPPELTQWVWEQSEGLPELVHLTLIALVQEGFLQPRPEGWQWYRPATWERPTPPSQNGRPAGVPSDLPLLFGRNRALWNLSRAVREHAVVAVVGGGGVGKSRLLQQLALESGESFPDGVHYISLTEAVPEGMIAAVARRMGVPLRSRSEVLTQLLNYLRPRRTLLILDGVDKAAESTAVLDRIREAAPQARLVVGSRWQLHFPREYVVRLSGLSTRRRGKDLSPAAHLFLHIARRSGGKHIDEPETQVQVEEICRWAEGSPMAVRILASWCNTLSPKQILRALGGVQGRSNPLEVTLDAFWKALSPDEQRRLAFLGLFESAFPLEAARAVAGASLFFLDALAAKAYLSRQPGGRFYLHPVLKHYARSRLRSFPEAVADAERRHALWYLQRLPEAVGVQSDAQRWEFLAPETDLPDIVKAWWWAMEQREAALLAQAAPWVFPSLGEVNRFVETLTLVRESCAALRRWPPAQRDHDYFMLRAYLETASAEFHYHLGEYPQARRMLERVYQRMFPCLSPLHQAHVAAVLGRLHNAMGDYETAFPYMEFAHRTYREAGAKRLVLSVLNAIGIAAYGQGDFSAAEHFFRKGLDIAEQIGHERVIPALLNNLGNIAWRRGRLDEADRLLHEALRLIGDEASLSLKASVLDTVARVECSRGTYRQALEHTSEALALSMQSSAWPNALIVMSTAACVWSEIGRRKEAADLVATILQHKGLPHYDHAQLTETGKRLPPGKPLAVSDVEALAKYVLNRNRRWSATLSRSLERSISGGQE